MVEAVVRDTYATNVYVTFHSDGSMPSHASEDYPTFSAAKRGLLAQGFVRVRKDRDADGDVLAVYRRR